METEITKLSEFDNGRDATVEQIIGSKETNSKEQTVESQSGIQVEKLTI